MPLPGYTDYLKAFPGRGFAGDQVPSVDHVEAALAAATSLVIISNPHNPSGVTLDPGELIAVARRHPSKILVVDESYVDFVPDPGGASVVGTDAANIVVLRSPSKFWGIAATRVGVAWCPDRERLAHLLGRRETWPISGLDVTVAEAAMASAEWAERCRLDLARDAAWLAEVLRELPGGSSSRTSACTTAASSPSTPTSSPRAWRSTASARGRSAARTAPTRGRCASWRRWRTSATRSRTRCARRRGGELVPGGAGPAGEPAARRRAAAR